MDQLNWLPEDMEIKTGCFGTIELPDMLPTRSQYGDIWQLGRHFLYCTDSENINHVNRIVRVHGVATLVFTDPPYQMSNMHGSKNSMTPISERPGHSTIMDTGMDNFDPKKFLDLLPLYFTPGTIAAYIFHSKDSTPDYYGWVRDQRDYKVEKEVQDPDMAMFSTGGYTRKLVNGPLSGLSCTPLVWYKVSGTSGKANPIPFGKAHHADVEYLMYIRKNGKWNNVDRAPLAHRGRVLEYPKQKGEHPTIKPIALIANQLLLTTDANDIIVDPYGGSGSTLIACEETGRRCIITEQLPRFCDLIISRWEGVSGKRAERIGSV